MKKLLLLIAFLIGVFIVKHEIVSSNMPSNNGTFTILAADTGMHFALYNTKTNERIDSIKPSQHQRSEGGKRGFALNSATGNRTVSIPQDGSLFLVVSRYPNFLKTLGSKDVGIIIDKSTGKFIKAILNPGRNAVSDVQSFSDINEGQAFADEALVNPENTITTMEWIRRYNRGEAVPKGRTR